jgi:hypothetical protein
MASVNQIVLLDGAVSGNTDTSAVSLEGLQTDFVATVNASAVGAGTSLAITVQRSVNGSDWHTWGAFSAITGTGIQIVNLTVAGLSYVRLSLVFTGGTTTATAKVVLSYDKKSK